MPHIHTLAEAEQTLSEYIVTSSHICKKDLTPQRMRPLLALLGNPQDKLRVIHVAGTSGKTSTTQFIAALLAQSGARVGHTVSPHVDSITERIQIDARPIEASKFCNALTDFLSLINDVAQRPSYFELMIAFAYWYFAEQSVDYAVIETGLGGRFDATNVVSRSDKICVITDIGIDHQHALGSTLHDIAVHKAGIIQPDNQVFMLPQSPAVLKVIKQECLERNATLNVLSNLNIDRAEHNLPLFQQRNWLLAKGVISYIVERDGFTKLTPSRELEAQRVAIPGRMEVVKLKDKTVVMDGAHNAQKMDAFMRSFVHAFPGQRATVVLALKHGKDYKSVIDCIAQICNELIITEYNVQDSPVAPQKAAVLARYAKSVGFTTVQVCTDSKSAFNQAIMTKNKICIVTGSFYLLSSLRPAILSAND